ncbi:MAG TPA: HAMP domain-containing sensor histidine kinase [Flavipsychrobacter sp.]|nr:HAMP domain-containing sensor histidine kinase [Flavipsychrobacter sp.]
MRRVFPIIVILISLSVLGIIFIQMLWIKSSIDFRKQQRDNEVTSAMNYIRQGIYDRFATKSMNIFNDEESKMDFMRRRFSSELLNDDEIRSIIDRSLTQNNIQAPFAFVITNVYGYPIKSSGQIPNGIMPIEMVVTPDGGNVAKETLYLYLAESNNYIMGKIFWMITASFIFTIIIISAFALTVRTMFSQKKLSEIKSDFINNMTHELKTPLATISLAIDALVNEKVIHNPDQIKYYSGMIKEENKRMNKQVEKILQSAKLERQEIKLNLQSLDAHEIIRKVADNLSLQVQEKNGFLVLNLSAARHRVDVDEVHFSNIIFNLLDNAIKYTTGDLRVEITTVVQAGMLAIKVKDNGIGMTKETLSHVFEKFYRAHTGNLHNVKGFGLGLNYVKALTEAHSGKVKVESTVGKGTTFTVTFPLSEGQRDDSMPV